MYLCFPFLYMYLCLYLCLPSCRCVICLRLDFEACQYRLDRPTQLIFILLFYLYLSQQTGYSRATTPQHPLQKFTLRWIKIFDSKCFYATTVPLRLHPVTEQLIPAQLFCLFLFFFLFFSKGDPCSPFSHLLEGAEESVHQSH